ncbi:hypothetical protein INT45_001637 [Circinella minor]|uniref:Uncharacterized protein n=1 Tax=Circinella minor TaxID=1195481 RepID=A0A8H7VI94_9FUNG|nr:hypothetical protein INT45_001637 [Circinella minor]
MFPRNVTELYNLRNVINILYKFRFATEAFVITPAVTPHPKSRGTRPFPSNDKRTKIPNPPEPFVKINQQLEH